MERGSKYSYVASPEIDMQKRHTERDVVYNIYGYVASEANMQESKQSYVRTVLRRQSISSMQSFSDRYFEKTPLGPSTLR